MFQGRGPMNLHRYYSQRLQADSLKELGGLRDHLMKRFTMMMRERRLAARACLSGARTRAYVAAISLPLALFAGTASAADATRPSRLHHASAQSAGSVETKGKVQSRNDDRASTKHGSGTAAKGKARASKAAPKTSGRGSQKADSSQAKSRSKSRRHKAEPEVVDDPIVMSRTGSRHIAHKSRPLQVATAAPNSQTSAADVAAAKKSLTVDDFVRAAGGTAVANPPAVTQGAFASGESHPDDERIEVSTTPDATAKPKPVAAAKPAPVVRAQPVHQLPAQVSDAGVNYDDAPQIPDAPRTKRVSGFGAEVEELPAAHADTAAKTPSAKHTVMVATNDDSLSDDRALQRELTDDAVKPMVVPMYTRSGHLIVPPPLKGTREILVHQNVMADNAGLSRIQDDADLDRMRADHLLLSFPDITALEINEDLPMNRRCARPWTVKFAADTARAFYARFHEPLRLNSAVRTVDYQLRLQRVNGNAAAVDGDGASPHLTGQAIDFGKHGMSVAQIAWMRSYLLPLMQAGKIDVEEEFQQACFHISVYGSYVPKKHVSPKMEEAQLRGEPKGQ